MSNLRAFFLGHPRLAAVLLAFALCMKALVPGGYMVGGEAKTFTIEICDGHSLHAISNIVIPQSGKTGDGQGGNHAKGDSVCPYSALGSASLASTDAIQIVLALAFILALGFVAVATIPVAPILFLRPPLRGPPVRV